MSKFLDIFSIFFPVKGSEMSAAKKSAVKKLPPKPVKKLHAKKAAVKKMPGGKPLKKPVAVKAVPVKKAVRKSAPAAKNPVAKKNPPVKNAGVKNVKGVIKNKPLAATPKTAKTAPPAKTVAAKNAASTSTPKTAPAVKPKAGPKETMSQKEPEKATGKNAAKNTAAVKSGKDEPNPAVLKKLIALGRARGYITYEELNTYLPGDEFSPEMIESTIGALSRADINVVEEGEAIEQGEQQGEAAEAAEETATAEPGGRSDDPVRMYLREMGNVELLSRDGEIEIAKRIEAGREMIISSLCESPMVMQEILSWRDDLANGALLLRDVIDLDAAYGADAEGKPVFAAAEVPVENVAEKVMEKKDDNGTAALIARAKEEERKKRERERAEREKAAKEKAEKEKAEKEKAAKEKASKAALKDTKKVTKEGEEDDDEEDDNYVPFDEAESEEGEKKEGETVEEEDPDDYDDAALSLVAMENAIKPKILETLDQFAKISQETAQPCRKNIFRPLSARAITPIPIT